MLRFLGAHFEELLGSVLLAIMATIAFINVIVRYCTSFSFAWTEEMTVNFSSGSCCSARRAPSAPAGIWA